MAVMGVGIGWFYICDGTYNLNLPTLGIFYSLLGKILLFTETRTHPYPKWLYTYIYIYNADSKNVEIKICKRTMSHRNSCADLLSLDQGQTPSPPPSSDYIWNLVTKNVVKMLCGGKMWVIQSHYIAIYKPTLSSRLDLLPTRNCFNTLIHIKK